MVRLIESAERLTGKAEREFADSVLEVSVGANRQVIEEMMGECARLHEGINGTVDTLRAFGHKDIEIKKAIMRRYALSEEEAEGYLWANPLQGIRPIKLRF